MRKESSLDKNRLQFLVLGRGDFFSRLYYSTSFIIFAGDLKLLVDCPEPLHKMIYEASIKARLNVKVEAVNHVILTHLHGDHSNGLEGYGFYKRFVQQRRPTLYTIREVQNDLWEHKLKAAMGYPVEKSKGSRRKVRLEDFFRVKILKPEHSHQIANCRIEIFRTKHYLPCFGFRLSFRGKSLGYSSDTTFDPQLINFLSRSDLILHETNYGGHTPYSRLLELPQKLRKKMLLVHIPDDFNVQRSRIHVAQQGKLYTV